MNVLFVSNLFPDRREPWRGLDNATLLHLLARRCRVRVLALRPSLPFDRQPLHPRAEDAAFEPVYVRVAYLPKVGGAVNHRLLAEAIRRPLRTLRKSFPFEVALGSWIFPDCCGLAIAARKDRFPFLAIAQGSDVHQYLRMRVRRQAITRWLPEAEAIVTRSRMLATLLENAGVAREKLHPIYNGIDSACFYPGSAVDARNFLGLPLDAPIVLFVGNLLPIKNPLLLVEAHAALCREGRFANARLVIVGSGSLEEATRRLAGALGFGEQVIHAGRRAPAEVATYLRAADLLALPSNDEGVPNVVLEAFACGLPVVASQVGGIPEVHPGDAAGKLVPPRNAPALTDALRAVLEHPLDREAIHRHSRAFTWERTVFGYFNLLQKASVTEMPLRT